MNTDKPNMYPLDANGTPCSLARVGPARSCVSVRCSEACLVQEVRLWT